MLDEQEITRLLDEAADGRLDESDTLRLIALLEQDETVRHRLALLTVVERLLATSKTNPVRGDRVLQALRKTGKQPAGFPPPPISRRQVPLWIPLAVVMGILVLGLGLWLFTGESRRPDVARPEYVGPASSESVPVQTPAAVTNEVHSPTNITASAGKPPPAQPEPAIESPPPSYEDTTPPPSGDGSGEPGFVPPMDGGSAPAMTTDSAANSGASLETRPKTLPHAPLIIVRLNAGDVRDRNATPHALDGLLSEIKNRTGLSYRLGAKSLDEIDTEPEKNPILYMTGHYHFAFTPAQRAKLNTFMMSGGMVIFDPALGSQPFYDSARRELGIICHDTPLQRLSIDHPIFHSYYDLLNMNYGSGVLARIRNRDDHEPWIEGVTTHCRISAAVSRWGMGVGWEKRSRDNLPAYDAEAAIRLGVNLFSYATAVRGWIKQSAPLPPPKATVSGLDKLFIGQVVYDGEWKTRPSALPILLRAFNQRTTVPVQLDVRELRLSDPRIFDAPLLYITGHEGFSLSEGEVTMLRKYLTNGGFLFAEACCGRKRFDQAFRAEMHRVLPDKTIAPLPRDNDVYSIPNPVKQIAVTPSLAHQLGTTVISPLLEGFEINGHTAVIYSPYGMAGSWENSQSPYALGYNDTEALKLGQNILMHAITH